MSEEMNKREYARGYFEGFREAAAIWKTTARNAFWRGVAVGLTSLPLTVVAYLAWKAFR